MTKLLPFFTPADIEAASFAIIEAEAPHPLPFQGGEWEVARRLVHAGGDLGLLDVIRFSDGAVAAGVAALRAGAPVLTDTRMAATGISLARLTALGGQCRCLLSFLDDPDAAAPATPDDAAPAPKMCPPAFRASQAAPAGRAAPGSPASQTHGQPHTQTHPQPHDDPPATPRTRAWHAVQVARAALPGSVFVAGNAPTALLALLEYLDHGGLPPALVVAMPVGFVNAAQAKALILEREVPVIAVTGRRGGTPLAVAAVNALLRLAAPEKN